MEQAQEQGQAQPIQPTVAKPPKSGGKKSGKKGGTSKAKWVEKFRPNTIGRSIVELIVDGKKSNEEILTEVKKKNKGCETTIACIAWYKTRARKEGIIK